MTDDELKLCLKDIPSLQIVTNQRIINFMKKHGKFYEPIKYAGTNYIMTFNYTVYPHNQNYG